MALEGVCLCLRCDDLIAQPMSFDELVNHYVNECQWYQSMSSWVPKRTTGLTSDDDEAPPKFVQTHGDKDKGHLACVATEAQLERLREIRNNDNERQDALIKHLNLAEPASNLTYWERRRGRENRRTCNLCPKVNKLGPKEPMEPVKMEVHIRTKHTKTPDLLIDSKRLRRTS
ncbi:hypothetical protein M407DRAFT_156207 [Tulasnella calospora MUT 4182]|uniref:Uncharacterized protein n=1 Tax=Tulasnella calospora MUT 4182 TaxID=1051891 RepID=A0A0C3Q5A6_9AGAM|nr:hypothetical protein M407DRAFT_156207 [Tulasnella calospora MUT 4182]